MGKAAVNKSNTAQSVSLNKEIYGKNTYKNVIDTEFSQLVPTTDKKVVNIDVNQFFQSYNELFFQINKNGETNSHEYLIKQSSEYIGFEQNSEDIEALLQEINQLRKDLLEANQKIVDLTTEIKS